MQSDHSLESYYTVLSCVAVCLVIQSGSMLLVCGSNQVVSVTCCDDLQEDIYPCVVSDHKKVFVGHG